MNDPPAPEGYAWSLPLLYMMWAVAILLLYPACRWYAGLKARRPAGSRFSNGGWLSYL